MRVEHSGVARAGSKVIVVGEHAVVYGAPALVWGMEPGVEATAAPHPGPVTLAVEPWDLRARVDGDTAADRALAALVRAAGLPASGVAVSARAAVPAGAGLGASASLATAVARALCAAHGVPDASERVADAVDASEQVYHGAPSGVDAAAVARPGWLWFQRGVGARPVAGPAPPLIVAYSGQRGETAAAVAKVAAMHARQPDQVMRCVDTLTRLCDTGRDAVVRGDWTALGLAMNRAHEVLRALGVSTPRLDAACERAMGAGALGAKLTGAGLGGCVAVLCPSHAVDGVCAAVRTEGFEVVVWPTSS